MRFIVRRAAFFGVTLMFLLTGCSQPSNTTNTQPTETSRPTLRERVLGVVSKKTVQLPVDNYLATYKRHGEYVEDRFRGYHVGDDIEVVDVSTETPVYAIADGVVKRVDTVSGYGGLIIVEHQIEDETVTAIYGHVDIASNDLTVGDRVTKGQLLANLGDHESAETDGERKHLHFALYAGEEDGRLQGYETNPDNLANWINPYSLLKQRGVQFRDGYLRSYNATIDPEGNKIFNLDFGMPQTWDVEYIPSLQALNLYDALGEGTARERSQVLIRYFDASQFLTLNTVIIHNIEDRIVGSEDYVARQYDIEKKASVSDFKDQPSWRNERHIVTDFRKTTGHTRYYVVAVNPEVDEDTYEYILSSMWIK